MKNICAPRLTGVLLVMFVSMGLGACSQSLESPFPSLANIVKLDGLTLSNQQKADEIRKLTAAQATHRAEALKEIRK